MLSFLIISCTALCCLSAILYLCFCFNEFLLGFLSLSLSLLLFSSYICFSSVKKKIHFKPQVYAVESNEMRNKVTSNSSSVKLKFYEEICWCLMCFPFCVSCVVLRTNYLLCVFLVKRTWDWKSNRSAVSYDLI